MGRDALLIGAGSSNPIVVDRSLLHKGARRWARIRAALAK
jgi:hypothetical protein